MRPRLFALALGSGILLVLAASVATVAALRLFRVPDSSGEVVVEELGGLTRILRDRAGVPHIESRGLEDAFVGLGFAHAQDRLWQMEVLRRSAKGTLSELFGRATLDIYRLSRTLGIARAAQKELEVLDPDNRRVLVAYARGVNAWIQLLQDARAPPPLEFSWLGLRPGAWEPADSLAIVRLRAWMLGRSLGASLLLDRLMRELGGVASERFFPGRTSVLPLEEVVRTWTELGRVADRWAATSGLRGRVGSLGFIVGADRSASAHPLLANDPHVEFKLPPVFYLAHLRTEAMELSGATWPGVPVFWTGTTGATAWGQVALHISVSDLYQETLHPEHPHRYDVAGRWVDAERVEERIQVRGGQEERVEVLRTRHGPLLVSALPDNPAASRLALRWTGQRKGSGVRALISLPKARNFTEFRKTLRDLPAPPSVFLYAHRKGAIGVQVAGDLPVRPIETGLLPVPGRSGWYDWRGTLAFERLPYRTHRHADWFVVGPRAEGLEIPTPVTWLWTSSGASTRLREHLQSARRVSLEQLLAIQREKVNAAGPEGVRRLLRGVEPYSTAASRVHAILQGWDGGTDVTAEGVVVYHVFRMRVLALLLRRHLPKAQIEELLQLAEPVPGLALSRYLEQLPRPLDSGLVHTALEQTWSWLTSEVSSNPKKWVWGRTHRLYLPHLFERLGGGLTRQLGRFLGRGPFSVPGDAGSIWAMHSDGGDPFRPRVGPAFRFAIDLSDPEHARFGLCGGQSGHPAAGGYDDGLEDWLAGRPRILWMHPADVAYHARGTWELRPAHP